MLTSRIYELDVLRGFAILLMIIFHFCYDLDTFQFVKIDFSHDLFWIYFRSIIIVIFLSIVGMSLYTSYRKNIVFVKFIRRITILFLAATLISVVTFFMFPTKWIYFGIIHFIFVASIIAVFFVKTPTIAFIVGIFIIVLSYYDYTNLHFLFLYTRTIFNIPYYTVDLVYFFPWMGVVLIGIYLQFKNLYGFKLKYSSTKNILAYMGRRSLLIYLIHQPILYGLVKGYFYL